MVELGKYTTLEVIKELDFGVYLDAYPDEILLPRKYIPPGTRIGDRLPVFIYRDSEDRLIATTLHPKAVVGDFALLHVADTNRYGVFMEWGLEKDLFVPFSEQNKRMVKGNAYVVKVVVDETTHRIIGSARIEKFLDYSLGRPSAGRPSADELTDNQAVDLLPFEYTDLGVKCIIDGRYLGVLYRNEIFQPVPLGESVRGYVKHIREDNKVDLSLTQPGYGQVLDSKEALWNQLRLNQGFLPLTDRSDPETIQAQLRMSKKNFKKAVGALYKEGRITLREDGIHLIPED